MDRHVADDPLIDDAEDALKIPQVIGLDEAHAIEQHRELVGRAAAHVGPGRVLIVGHARQPMRGAQRVGPERCEGLYVVARKKRRRRLGCVAHLVAAGRHDDLVELRCRLDQSRDQLAASTGNDLDVQTLRVGTPGRVP